MRTKILLLGISFLSSPVWADAQMEIMAEKLERLEYELALVQKKVYQAPNLSGSETKMPQNIDEFYAALDTQNQIIQDLTQKNEKMGYELNELKNQISRMNNDFNFRFKELKQSAQPENTEKPKAPSPSVSEEEVYNEAYTLLKNGEYEKAEQSFISFMEKFPQGKLVGNANYWLAESYYARQKWNEAAGLFADGFTKYKDNPKANDSMFKLGLTMKQMNKKKEACTAFKKLLKDDKNLNKQLKTRTQKEIKELKCL